MKSWFKQIFWLMNRHPLIQAIPKAGVGNTIQPPLIPVQLGEFDIPFGQILGHRGSLHPKMKSKNPRKYVDRLRPLPSLELPDGPLGYDGNNPIPLLGINLAYRIIDNFVLHCVSSKARSGLASDFDGGDFLGGIIGGGGSLLDHDVAGDKFGVSEELLGVDHGDGRGHGVGDHDGGHSDWFFSWLEGGGASGHLIWGFVGMSFLEGGDGFGFGRSYFVEGS